MYRYYDCVDKGQYYEYDSYKINSKVNLTVRLSFYKNLMRQQTSQETIPQSCIWMFYLCFQGRGRFMKSYRVSHGFGVLWCYYLWVDEGIHVGTPLTSGNRLTGVVQQICVEIICLSVVVQELWISEESRHTLCCRGY